MNERRDSAKSFASSLKFSQATDFFDAVSSRLGEIFMAVLGFVFDYKMLSFFRRSQREMTRGPAAVKVCNLEAVCSIGIKLPSLTALREHSHGSRHADQQLIATQTSQFPAQDQVLRWLVPSWPSGRGRHARLDSAGGRGAKVKEFEKGGVGRRRKPKQRMSS